MTRNDEDIDPIAKAIFDAMPHGHPRGEVPDWGIQPERLRDVFRTFARGDRPLPHGLDMGEIQTDPHGRTK